MWLQPDKVPGTYTIQHAAADVDAFLQAALRGDADRVRELLGEGGVGVNDANAQGIAALFAAAQGGNAALADMLIEAGATVDQANDEGATPLYMASQEGKLEVVKALIDAKATINKANEDGTTPLFIASQNAHLEVVTTLIEAGAEINQVRNDGRPPIYIASQQGHAPIVQVLIDAGARTADLMYKGTFSPLHAAACIGHLECVMLLTGFRPDTPGWTTFLFGATSKKELAASLVPPGERPPSYLPKIFDRVYLEPIWKFQQERYSDLHLKDGTTGLTALEIAVANKKTDVAKLLRGMMVLPKDGENGGEKKAATTKGGKT